MPDGIRVPWASRCPCRALPPRRRPVLVGTGATMADVKSTVWKRAVERLRFPSSRVLASPACSSIAEPSAGAHYHPPGLLTGPSRHARSALGASSRPPVGSPAMTSICSRRPRLAPRRHAAVLGYPLSPIERQRFRRPRPDPTGRGLATATRRQIAEALDDLKRRGIVSCGRPPRGRHRDRERFSQLRGV